jgi:ATP-grasp domain, R2K clade family 3
VIHFLFPSAVRNREAPDEMFAEQVKALTNRGFTTSVFSDAVLTGSNSLKNIPADSNVVYRGWMLKAQEYEALARAIKEAGATAFTTPHDYIATHHLPNWYPLLSDLTPETRVYPADTDIVAELRKLGWNAYFIKDYVKSLKSRRGSIVRVPNEAVALLAEMREYRGEIEGGICVRRVEEFMTDSERRYFVVNGVPHSADGSPIPPIVEQCAVRISSKFFSVDVIQRSDGNLRVVEIGDGQVSDLVGWSEEAFAAIWASSVR